MALLAALAIREARATGGDKDTPRGRTAYVLHQLKRPEEVEILRQTYRERFYLVAAHTPLSIRRSALASEIAESRGSADSDAYAQIARELVDTDESESSRGVRSGQNVRDTFALADFFVDASSPERLADHMRRVVEIVFGHPARTPTIDEFGMNLAYGAARRSGDLSRQVGAAILGARGGVLALGTNEVPRFGGGAYWTDDEPDQRDWALGYDSSYRRRVSMVMDLVQRLAEHQWLREDIAEGLEGRVREALEGEDRFLRDASLMDVIEFGRTVHAEMLAITDAAQRGIALAGGTMYTTTFPCHNCARHIVSAGIRSVVYVEPYPKSLAGSLFQDSILVDPADPDGAKVTFKPFVGMGPVSYMSLFEAGVRKTPRGEAVPWDPRTATPKLVVLNDTYIGQEVLAVEGFDQILGKLGGGEDAAD